MMVYVKHIARGGCFPFIPVVAALLAAIVIPARGQTALVEPEEAVIHYDSNEGLSDPVALLQQQLARRKTTLRRVEGFGYLRALLKALHIPISSQTLVFSKTSTHANLVSPQTPRAIYFNDDVSVAWVPGAPVIDLAAVDPSRGPIFYTLDQGRDKTARFTRRSQCMQCHLGAKTVYVPGLTVRSVYTRADGTALAQVDGFVNGHSTPLELRWGGWYVTGTHAGAFHLGNLVSEEPRPPELTELVSASDVIDLRGRFNTRRYLSPHSDLIALLVLEHQVRMQNLLTHANYETCLAVAQVAEERSLPSPTEHDLSDQARERIAHAGELLLEYMLFRNEAPLAGPVTGTSPFAAEFQKGGPRDAKRRSLRELDLKTRLVRYPCSYLIYSKSFDALPDVMKHYLWLRLEQVLNGQDRSPLYATMSLSDRQAVFEILVETKPEFRQWLRRRALAGGGSGRHLAESH